MMKISHLLKKIHVSHDTLYPKEFASVTRSGRVYDSSGKVRENGQQNPREKESRELEGENPRR